MFGIVLLSVLESFNREFGNRVPSAKEFDDWFMNGLNVQEATELECAYTYKSEALPDTLLVKMSERKHSRTS